MSMGQFVKDLFEARHINNMDYWPDDFNAYNSVDLINEIAEYAGSHFSKKIRLSCWDTAERANALLEKFERAQPFVTGKIFETSFDALEIDFDYNVMGSCAFMPKVMPNGSVLIRNHHRVIGISEEPAAQVLMNKYKLHDLITKLSQANAHLKEESLEENYHFFILHRSSENGVTISIDPPSEFSSWGQTLICISGNLDLSLYDELAESPISSVAESSRTGCVLLRVFEDRFFIYSMYRASDEYDTLFEEFSEMHFAEYNEQINGEFALSFENMKTFRDRARVMWETSDLVKPPESSLMHFYMSNRICNHHCSFAAKKALQVRDFKPFFAVSYNQPAGYTEGRFPYFAVGQSIGHNGFILEVDPRAFKTISNLEYNFDEYASNLLHVFVDKFNANIKFIIPSKYSFGAAALGSKDVFELSAPEVREYMSSTLQKVKEDLEAEIKDWEGKPENQRVYSSKEEIEEDALSCDDFSLAFLVSFQGEAVSLDLKRISDSVKVFSEDVTGGVHLYVTRFGLSQGYSWGDFDTGNASTLLLEGEDEDDE